jgi:predicted PurR-regulated permease PerM
MATSISSLPSPQPEVCSKVGLKVENYFESFYISMGSMIGLGGLFSAFGVETPLDKLKAQVSSITNEIQQFDNVSAQNFAKSQSEFDDQILASISSMQRNNRTLVNYNTEILQDDISSNSTYIASLFILALILLFYILTLPVK